MTHSKLHPDASELGKKSQYSTHYNPEILFPIARQLNRDDINIHGNQLPFFGFDVWNHYEVSWLNGKGKPIAALAEIIFDCQSPNIIESKSLKLYFNSLNNSQYKDVETVKNMIQKDLSSRAGSEVIVNIIPIHHFRDEKLWQGFDGICLDELDVECSTYQVNENLLSTESHVVEETLHSNLLKSNCLVTNQPDWGSVEISYKGNQINHVGLLKYIVSFRNHNEFHEHCIERIFVDIMKKCRPQELTVHGRYTRRGGLDINPYRSTKPQTFAGLNKRLCRQ